MIAPVTQNNNNNNNGPWLVAPRERREPSKAPPGSVLLMGKQCKVFDVEKTQQRGGIAGRSEREREKKRGISIIDMDQWSRIRRRMIGELSLTAVLETLTGVANKPTVILSLFLLLTCSLSFSLSLTVLLSPCLFLTLSPSPLSLSLFLPTSLFFPERRVHSLFLAHSIQFRSTPLDDGKGITAATKAMIMFTTKTLCTLTLLEWQRRQLEPPFILRIVSGSARYSWKSVARDDAKDRRWTPVSIKISAFYIT